MEIPDSIAAQLAVLRQNVALSVIKSSTQAEQAIANILEATLTVGPPARGGNVNFSV